MTSWSWQALGFVHTYGTAFFSIIHLLSLGMLNSGTILFIVILFLRRVQYTLARPILTHRHTYIAIIILCTRRCPACCFYRKVTSRRVLTWFLRSRSSATAPDMVHTTPSKLLKRAELQRLFAIACKHMPRYVHPKRTIDVAYENMALLLVRYFSIFEVAWVT